MLRLALCLLLAASACAAEWSVTWKDAAAKAATAGQPILINFTGSDWCGWCIKLKDEVFKTDAFKTWAKDNVVLLELDFPRRKQLPAEQKADNQRMMEKYGIQGFPTVVIVDATGKELGRLGYQRGGPAAWTAAAQRSIPAKAKP